MASGPNFHSHCGIAPAMNISTTPISTIFFI
jgi:hypothetical protein